jgi:hypothetical protein
MATRISPARELTIGLSTFAAYVVVNLIAERHDPAQANARRLFDFEQRLNIDIEPRLNHWLADQGWLRVAANYEYAYTYILSAFGLLYWLYRRRPDLYRWARRSFVWLNLVAMACFLTWPLAPPRLMTDESAGFVDTVREGNTVGSWGTPWVDSANTVAAMPSLHLGWALWVSAVLAAIASGWRVQVISAVHVAVTCWVIVATANHYVLDAVAVVPLVWLCLRLAGARPAGAIAEVPAPDAFFLHADRPDAPQHVGGVILVSTDGTAGAPTPDEVLSMLRERLSDLPRLRQRLSPDGNGWRRPRWRPAEAVDPAEHLEVVDVSHAPDPMAAYHRIVAEIAATPLRRDRPLWRAVYVPGVAPDLAGFVFVVHHVVSDGLGTIAQSRRLLDPYPPPHLFPEDMPRGPGVLVRSAAVVAGLAKLARDGKPRDLLPAGSPHRGFATEVLDLAEVRALARAHGVRLTDVLLCATAAAVREVSLRAGRPVPRSMRTAVPLMVARPTEGEAGNFTMAVLIDVPLGEADPRQRLAAIAAASRARTRRPDRALASRFVLQALGGAAPAPAFRAFARGVYGAPYFSAIVSNMPGPTDPTAFVGRPLTAAFPLVPTAPGAPLALGALSWGDRMCLALSVDAAFAPAAEVMIEIAAELSRLRTSVAVP